MGRLRLHDPVSERDLEDYFWKYPKSIEPSYRRLGRQVYTGHGLLDLLFWDRCGEYVLAVEIKNRQLYDRDVAQICRYVGDLKRIVETPGIPNDPPIRVVGMLIARDADDDIRASCWGAGVWVYIWRLEPSGALVVCPAWEPWRAPISTLSWLHRLPEARA